MAIQAIREMERRGKRTIIRTILTILQQQNIIVHKEQLRDLSKLVVEKSYFLLAFDFWGASPKILICEARPRRTQGPGDLKRACPVLRIFCQNAVLQISSLCLKDFTLLKQNLLRTFKNFLFSCFKLTNLGEIQSRNQQVYYFSI